MMVLLITLLLAIPGVMAIAIAIAKQKKTWTIKDVTQKAKDFQANLKQDRAHRMEMLQRQLLVTQTRALA